MLSKRIVGIVLFMIGGIFVMAAMSSSQPVVDQASSTFTGRFSHTTTWYFMGGAAAAILGVLMVFLSPRRGDA